MCGTSGRSRQWVRLPTHTPYWRERPLVFFLPSGHKTQAKRYYIYLLRDKYKFADNSKCAARADARASGERVAKQGHDVPVDKIRSRYKRSLNLLYEAVKNSDRAYLWDNSKAPGHDVFVARVENGKQTDINPYLKVTELPRWFFHYFLWADEKTRVPKKD